MGHFIFCILHFFALIFGFVFLFITIPAHIIYSVLLPHEPVSVGPMTPPIPGTTCIHCQAIIPAGGALYCWSCGEAMKRVG